MNEDLKGFVKGTVCGFTSWTENEFSIQVKADIQPYIAGQFTKLALKDSNGEWSRRAYSFVNSPNHSKGHQEMEFLIIDVESGNLSPHLAALKVGDTVFVGEKASGFMTLDEIPARVKDLWLLSTGTAIGPFLSILSELESQKRFEHVILVHAVRTQQELVYSDFIKRLQQKYAGRLIYIPIVSREKIVETLSGRIPALLKNRQLLNAAGINPTQDDSFFYLCGNPDMVHDTRDALLALGFEKHLRRSPGHFSSENYW